MSRYVFSRRPSVLTPFRPPLLLGSLGLLLLAVPAFAQVGPPDDGPQITITPGDSTYNITGTTLTLSISITWCSDAAFNDATRSITLDYVDVSANFTTTGNGANGCVYGAHSTGSITLTTANDGVHRFVAAIEDVNSYYGETIRRYTIRWPGYVAPKYQVAVDKADYTIEAMTSGSRATTFTVSNLGSRAASYSLAAHCANAVVSCSVSPTSVSLDTTASTRSAAVTLNFTTGTTAGDTGRVTLLATNSGSGLSADRDSATTDVLIATTTALRTAGVVLANGGDVVDRGLCETIAVGPAAASECGDLRLAHALPTITTFAKPRTPILLYNSAHARPQPVIVADVTFPSTDPLPTSVQATVFVNGTSYSSTWNGSDWSAAGQTRRIGVLVDATSWTTGLYTYQLEIRRITGGTSTVFQTVSGQLPVVNRAASAFGAGWWLAGLEQLVPVGDSLLWVGGDGSTRLYRKQSASLWRATAIDHPDSLIASGSTYILRLPSGTQIEFNGAGQHVATRPLTGWPTLFRYSGSALSRIIIPAASGDTTRAVYAFAATSTSLTATLVTPLSSRAVVGTISAGALVTLQEPDATQVQFGYGTGANAGRVQSRTDRTNHTVSFGYDAAQHVVSRTETVGTQTIAIAISPAESRGVSGTTYATAQSPDSTSTIIDGPRTDVADLTRIWVNRFGAPIRVRNAIGRDTRIAYDSTWPGLAREVVSVGGAITRAWYNARGLVDSTKTYNLRYSGDVAPASVYTWHPTFAVPTAITAPGPVETHYGYYSDGSTQFVQVGADTAGRFYSTYYDTTTAFAGMYRASSVPGRSERDSVLYDAALANPVAFKDRRGHWTYSARDEYGRSRVDSLLVATSTWRRDSTFYDLAGRVIKTITAGDKYTYSLPAGGTDTVTAQSLFVTSSYDAEGRPLSVSRWGVPDPTNVDVVTNLYTYDAAGRKLSEVPTGALSTFHTYDVAGNVLTKTGGGGNLIFAYDAMGRVLRRIAAAQTYQPTACSIFYMYSSGGGSCSYTFPLSTAGAAITIPGDTSLFSYDAAGDVVRADNAAARIRRTYSPGGLILTDTLAIRTLRYTTSLTAATVASEFASHVYGLGFGYDTAGRRTTLQHPDNMDPCSGPCAAQRYVYQPATGRLDSLVDVRTKPFRFAYNIAGQLARLTLPGGVTDSIQYDAEGAVSIHDIVAGSLTIIADTLTYDALGRIYSGHGRNVRYGDSQILDNRYSPLGAVVYHELAPGPDSHRIEAFRLDALGNQYWSRREHAHLGASDDEPAIRNLTYDVGGRLVESTPPTSVTHDADLFKNWYDVEGRVRYVGRIAQGPTIGSLGETDFKYSQEVSYYDGSGRLVLHERHGNGVQQTSGANEVASVNEWYRYDALGRRVLVHDLRNNQYCTAKGCESTVQRYVWDGNNLLYEIRSRAAATDADYTVESDVQGGIGQYLAPQAYGRVAYTHAGGIDRPLGIIRINGSNTVFGAVYPLQNWRGLYDTGTDDSGGISALADSIRWAGRSATVSLGANPPANPFMWFGSLVTEQADASGLMYRRNRYYDPQSGRFTQADPIGVAGGMNSYGFAGGDPVNFTDPFGLCPIEKDGLPCAFAGVLAGGAVGFTYGLAVGAVTAAGSGGLLAPLSGVEVAGATLSGALLGGLIGAGRDLISGVHILFNGSDDGGTAKPTPGEVAGAVNDAGATVTPHPTNTGEGATIKWPDGGVTDVRVENHPLPGSRGQPVKHGNVETWDPQGNRVQDKHIIPPL